MYIATEDHTTVLSVGRRLRQNVNWSVMFVFTLVQSRTHVDTVQNVLHFIDNSRHICWSHTMKVLGWHVTFVRRSSATVVALRYMFVGIRLWSRMFAVTVQSVSVQQVNWNSISQNTRDISSLAACYVVNVSDTKVMSKYTSVDVVMTSDSTVFKDLLLLSLLKVKWSCSVQHEKCCFVSLDCCLLTTLNYFTELHCEWCAIHWLLLELTLCSVGHLLLSQRLCQWLTYF